MADIELMQTILGLEPFVLLTYSDGGEGEDDLRLKIKAGGGIRTAEDIKNALELAIASLSEAVPSTESRGTDA